MGLIKQLKKLFTGEQIFPVTKTNAVYDDELGRMDSSLKTCFPYMTEEEVDGGTEVRDCDTFGGKEPSYFASNSDLTRHTDNTSNPHGVTKSQIGLGSVDNTADKDKPISDATQNVLDAKASNKDLTEHSSSKSNPHAVTKSQVGLGNVDNTSDADKPVSTATQTALDAINNNLVDLNNDSPYNTHFFAKQNDVFGRGDNANFILSTGIYFTAKSTICLPILDTYGILKVYSSSYDGRVTASTWIYQEWSQNGYSNEVWYRWNINYTVTGWSDWVCPIKKINEDLDKTSRTNIISGTTAILGTILSLVNSGHISGSFGVVSEKCPDQPVTVYGMVEWNKLSIDQYVVKYYPDTSAGTFFQRKIASTTSSWSGGWYRYSGTAI